MVMTIQLFINGELAATKEIWGNEQYNEYLEHYRKIAKRTMSPWEIVLTRRVIPRKMKPGLQKRWNMWVEKNGAVKDDGFKINKQWNTKIK